MASFSSHKIKVKTETLDQIEEILKIDPEGADAVRDAINAAVNKIWLNTCGGGEAMLILTQDERFTVVAKGPYKEKVTELLGEGPYTVVKSCKSWVGISEGLYQLETEAMPVPASWFEKKSEPKKKEKKETSTALTLLMVLLSILQSSAMILLLI